MIYKVLLPEERKEKEALSSQLKELWQSTFGDSDEYVELLYDTYLDDALICVGYENKSSDRIIASLTAIPYTFGEPEIKGWYLCGLSTIPVLRGRGIMGKMMRLTEEAAISMGDRLMFLIPADTRLEKYYNRKGYGSGRRRLKLHLPAKASSEVKDNKTEGEGPSYRLIETTWSTITKAERKNLIDYLKEAERREYEDSISHEKEPVGDESESVYHVHESGSRENGSVNKERKESQKGIALFHSDRDWEAILRENEISGGRIILVKISDSDTIAGVALGYVLSEGQSSKIEAATETGTPSDSENAEPLDFIEKPAMRNEPWFEVRRLLGQRKALEYIISKLRDKGDIKLCTFEDQHNMENEFASEIISTEVDPYLMVKILDLQKQNESKSSESENLKLSTSDQSAQKYSIFRNRDEVLDKCQNDPNRVFASLLLE